MPIENFSHVRWVAWGVLEVDKIDDRQKRRVLLRKIREELAPHGYTLHVGGAKNNPSYSLDTPPAEGEVRGAKQFVISGKDALRDILAKVLKQLGEDGKDAGETSVGSLHTQP